MHIIKLWLNDTTGLETTDIVYLELIDDIAPEIEALANRTVELLDPVRLEWNITEENPQGYHIYVDDQLWVSGVFESNVIFEGLFTMGLHNITLEAWDENMNYAVSTVWITVELVKTTVTVKENHTAITTVVSFTTLTEHCDDFDTPVDSVPVFMGIAILGIFVARYRRESREE